MAPSTRQAMRSPPPAISPRGQQQQQQQQPQQPQQQAQVQFAIAPGLANNEILDFNSDYGKDTYKHATKPLLGDTEKYDGSSTKLQSFLYHIRVRADEYG